jgi:hypothetical protein
MPPNADRNCDTCRYREKSYQPFDALGLYLEIAATGSKLWRLKYRDDGRENRLALGA